MPQADKRPLSQKQVASSAAGPAKNPRAPVNFPVVPLSIESVPPKLYGGTERIVAYLAEELLRRGHEVTLYAAGDSTVNVPRTDVRQRSSRPVIPYLRLFASMAFVLVF